MARAACGHSVPGGSARRAGSDVWFPLDLYPLVTQELHAGPSMNPPTPVSPEQRLSSDAEGMQQHTHLARLRGLAAIPWLCCKKVEKETHAKRRPSC
ncbi:hypothetical protein KSX_96360 [Ktedonospora formicarum]|uniref:Uncharacterized protein n=1 Tax=Ktedonospora formicarum TaxID=2778364 RepID=A0A8J3ICJ0_9CHLR|nr:hypothetical protein KSX_96360 [Ktedonospora formicarum]